MIRPTTGLQPYGPTLLGYIDGLAGNSLLAYGAVGAADDTATFTAAIASGLPFSVPAGTYIVSYLNFNVPNQVVTLAPGATIKAKAGGGGGLIEMSAAGVQLIGFGATIDNNNVGTTASTAIYGHAADQRVEGLTIINIPGYGMNMQGDRVEIVDNYVINPGSGAAGIIVQNASTSVDLTAPTVTGNRVSVASGSGYGIQMHVNGARNVFRPRVSNNDVVLPALSTSGIGIELYGGNIYGSVVNNTVEGGSIGISVDQGPSVTVSGNAVHGSFNYCIELALSFHCNVAGNTIDGNALSGTGVSISNTGTGYNTVTGNTIGNLLSTGGAGVFSQGSTSMGTVIVGNNITAKWAVLITGNSKHTVVGNTLVAASAGASSVELNGVTDSVVANNVCSGWSLAAVNVFTGTMNGLIIGPNVLANGTPADITGGWTPGTNGVGSRLFRGTRAPTGLATPTVTASPFTYTNVSMEPMMVYLRGGTVSNITKSGISIATATPATLYLGPGESFTVTYTAAPTMNYDKF